jgi:hypothetical protein
VRAECIQSETERIFAWLETAHTQLQADVEKIDFSHLSDDTAQLTREAIDGLAAAAKCCRDPQCGCNGHAKADHHV